MMKYRQIKGGITILMVLVVVALFTSPSWADAPMGYSAYEFLPGPNYTQSDMKALLKISSDMQGLPALRIAWQNPDGTPTNCAPLGGACVTNYEYSDNGYVISSTSEFYIAGQQRPTGTYTAIVFDCTYTMNNICISWEEMFRANFTISDGSTTYTISGNAGVPGATLSYVDGVARTAAADGSGNYTITIPSGWSGTLTPSKAGYTFSPESRSFTNVLGNQTDQDFTATDGLKRIYLPQVTR